MFGVTKSWRKTLSNMRVDGVISQYSTRELFMTCTERGTRDNQNPKDKWQSHEPYPKHVSILPSICRSSSESKWVVSNAPSQLSSTWDPRRSPTTLTHGLWAHSQSHKRRDNGPLKAVWPSPRPPNKQGLVRPRVEEIHQVIIVEVHRGPVQYGWSRDANLEQERLTIL